MPVPVVRRTRALPARARKLVDVSNRVTPEVPATPEFVAVRTPDAARVRRVPGSRRAVLPPMPGTDPTPQATREAVLAAEDTDRSWGGRPAAANQFTGANDAQLLQDVPPHWG